MERKRDFTLEALVDFCDDALTAHEPLTERHVDSMMAVLAGAGVRRVLWTPYGDWNSGYFLPAGIDRPPGGRLSWRNYALTYQALANPLAVAIERAHAHGMEIYGYFKPYETGPAVVFPQGSPEAREWGRLGHVGGYLSWLDPFVLDNPGLRIERKGGGAAASRVPKPVTQIELTKRDASPTRITAERLQIWVSSSNYRYVRAVVPFTVSEAVRAAGHDVRSIDGSIVTRRGDPVRVLAIRGIRLDSPYLLVTTDFSGGPADFENTGTDMMRALDEHGKEIPGSFATGRAIYMADRVDFRSWGLVFDHGWGQSLVRLDEPNGNGRDGIVAFANAQNGYLPGALCESEPLVQAYWLSQVDRLLAQGVDGIDFREENHSTHTDFPSEYGYNASVLEACERTGAGDSPESISRVRGEAYTLFLRKAKAAIAAAGKRMRINLQVDFLRPDPPRGRLLAFPANIEFQWRRWIDEGLLDEAVMRFYHLSFDCLWEDEIARSMIDRCGEHRIPVAVNRYVSKDDPGHLEEYRRVRDDGRFSAFTLYETDSFMDTDASGRYLFTLPVVERICREHRTGKP